MGNRFAEEPLLFITQPTTHRPEAPMQYNSFTPKKKQVKKDKDVQRKVNPSRIYKRNYFQEESKHLERKALEEIREQEEIGTAETKEKGFKNMTLEEKVDYFRDTPVHTPKLRCELITKDRKYRGVISDYKDDHVFIRVGRRSTSEEVPFSDITDVRMLGF